MKKHATLLILIFITLSSFAHTDPPIKFKYRNGTLNKVQRWTKTEKICMTFAFSGFTMMAIGHQMNVYNRQLATTQDIDVNPICNKMKNLKIIGIASFSISATIKISSIWNERNEPFLYR
jgi:hypothetical protein